MSQKSVFAKWQKDNQEIRKYYTLQETKTKKFKDLKTGEFTNKEEVTITEFVFTNNTSYDRVIEANKNNKFEITKLDFDWTTLMQRFEFRNASQDNYTDDGTNNMYYKIQFLGSDKPEPTNSYEEVASQMEGDFRITYTGEIVSLVARLAVDEVKVKFGGPFAGATVKEAVVHVITQKIEGYVVPKTITVDYHIVGGAIGLTLVKKRCQQVSEYTYKKMSPEEQTAYFNKINGKPKT